MGLKTEYNYGNVFLTPRKTIVDSRKECDTSVEFCGHKFSMPVIPANMLSVVNEKTCEMFAKRGYFYVMHRFGGFDPLPFIVKMKQQKLVSSISLGVNSDSYRILRSIEDSLFFPDFITIDIANCWCLKCKKMIEEIKNTIPGIKIIAGNVATPEAVEDLQSWGADAIKVCIGPGARCMTKLNTGFTRGTVNTIIDCSDVANVPIIADGGIKEPGDIAKAICLGATMVMAGSIFAGYEQSAGEIISIEGKGKFKEMFGSSTEHSKGKKEHIEGDRVLIGYKGDMTVYLKHLEESLRSSISYAGGSDLSALKMCEVFHLEE